MTAQLQFRDLTLGYDRHPAVHHLDGAVQQGALIAVVGPNGAGKSTLFKGIVGALKPLAGRIERDGLGRRTSPICRRSPRSTALSDRVYDMVAMGLWRRAGLFGGIGAKDRDDGRAGDRRRRAHRLRAAADRHAVRRADAAHAVRAAAAAGRARDRARRAVQRHRPQDLADLLALVRRWHGEQRTVLAALHDIDLVKANFPQTLLLAREPVAWGDTAEVLTADNMHKARQMCEAFDEQAAACAVPEPV